MNKSGKEFTGRVAMITGGARNIGLSVARELGTKGAEIAILDICRDLKTIPYAMSTKEDLDSAVRGLRESGVGVEGFVCDVRDEAQVASTVKEIAKRFGRLDILVNNAGVISLTPITELTETGWNEVLDVCLKGVYLTCKHAVPLMMERRYGKIVNISSVAGAVGLGTGAHYCAAKHGVIGLTKALARELASHNINVNAVLPGTTESLMLQGLAEQIGLTSDAYDHFSERHMFKDRKVTPLDIARAVRWLVSEESRCMTGEVMRVDAGWLAGG